MSDYYELLQVSRDAGDEAIKKSYRRLARLYHPDSNKARFAAEHMTLLNAAYGMLSDPVKRRRYDELLAEAARRAVEPQVYEMGSARAAPRHSAQPWLLWIGITAVLVVIAFIGTLYTLRSSIPAFSLALFPDPDSHRRHTDARFQQPNTGAFADAYTDAKPHGHSAAPHADESPAHANVDAGSLASAAGHYPDTHCLSAALTLVAGYADRSHGIPERTFRRRRYCGCQSGWQHQDQPDPQRRPQ